MAISSLFASAARLRSGSRRGWVAAAVVGVVLWSSGCTPRGDQDAGGAPHGEDAGEAKGKLKRLDTGRAGAPTQPAKGHAANPTPTSPKKDATPGHEQPAQQEGVAEIKNTVTLKGHTAAVYSVAFGPDGKTLASASADKTIKLWDLENNKERLTLTGHLDPLSSIAFSPDGKLLVSGAGAIRFDPGRLGEVKLWDTDTGQLLADLKGHNDGVSSVAFSSDGKTVASAGRDHLVRVWDVSAYAAK